LYLFYSLLLSPLSFFLSILFQFPPICIYSILFSYLLFLSFSQYSFSSRQFVFILFSSYLLFLSFSQYSFSSR
jgi:hypothetical protein